MLEQILIGLTRFLVGGHGHWRGVRPTRRQRIYFSNHASNMDSIVLWAALPRELRPLTHPVAAEDYWAGSPLRRHFALNVLGAVLVRRGGGAEGMAPVNDMLRAGGSLIIYPEGTRGQNILPGPFKTGIYHLAIAFPEVELVPVYLTNLNRALPKGVWIPVPVSAAAIFGPPVQVLPGEPRDAFLARAREAIVALAQGVHPEAVQQAAAAPPVEPPVEQAHPAPPPETFDA